MTDSSSTSKNLDPAESFWKQNGKRYAEAIEESTLKNSQVAFELTNHLFPKRKLDVLEIACGSGIYGKWIFENHSDLINHLALCDINEPMIELCKIRFEKIPNSEKVKIVNCSCLDLTENFSEKFDVIFGFSIIYLLTDPSELVTKLKPLMKEDSIFIFSAMADFEKSNYYTELTPVWSKYRIVYCDEKSPIFQFSSIEHTDSFMKALGLKRQFVQNHIASKKFENDDQLENMIQWYLINKNVAKLSSDDQKKLEVDLREALTKLKAEGKSLDYVSRIYAYVLE